MTTYRISCKTHNNDKVIISVGVLIPPNYTLENWSVDKVWDRITLGDTFYTNENNHMAIVRKGKSPTGRKYITTHPDGITENNLDELKSC